MLVVHATKKLLDRVGTPTVEPTTRSTAMLGSWYATVLFWRPQVALLVNERTLLPLLMPLAPAATLLERLPSWIDVTLDAHGVPRTFIDAELAHAADIGLAKTNSRSVLGVMNEFARLADWQKEAVADDDDLIAVALRLSEVPTSPLYQRHVSPDRELAAVVAEAPWRRDAVTPGLGEESAARAAAAEQPRSSIEDDQQLILRDGTSDAPSE